MAAFRKVQVGGFGCWGFIYLNLMSVFWTKRSILTCCNHSQVVLHVKTPSNASNFLSFLLWSDRYNISNLTQPSLE